MLSVGKNQSEDAVRKYVKSQSKQDECGKFMLKFKLRKANVVLPKN